MTAGLVNFSTSSALPQAGDDAPHKKRIDDDVRLLWKLLDATLEDGGDTRREVARGLIDKLSLDKMNAAELSVYLEELSFAVEITIPNGLAHDATHTLVTLAIEAIPSELQLQRDDAFLPAHDGGSSQTSYSGNLLRNVGGTLRWRPFANGFELRAGAFGDPSFSKERDGSFVPFVGLVYSLPELKKSFVEGSAGFAISPYAVIASSSPTVSSADRSIVALLPSARTFIGVKSPKLFGFDARAGAELALPAVVGFYNSGVSSLSNLQLGASISWRSDTTAVGVGVTSEFIPTALDVQDLTQLGLPWNEIAPTAFVKQRSGNFEIAAKLKLPIYREEQTVAVGIDGTAHTNAGAFTATISGMTSLAGTSVAKPPMIWAGLSWAFGSSDHKFQANVYADVTSYAGGVGGNDLHAESIPEFGATKDEGWIKADLGYPPHDDEVTAARCLQIDADHFSCDGWVRNDTYSIDFDMARGANGGFDVVEKRFHSAYPELQAFYDAESFADYGNALREAQTYSKIAGVNQFMRLLNGRFFSDGKIASPGMGLIDMVGTVSSSGMGSVNSSSCEKLYDGLREYFFFGTPPPDKGVCRGFARCAAGLADDLGMHGRAVTLMDPNMLHVVVMLRDPENHNYIMLNGEANYLSSWRFTYAEALASYVYAKGLPPQNYFDIYSREGFVRRIKTTVGEGLERELTPDSKLDSFLY